MRPVHSERHLVERIGWLRAAVLGANDGIISTSSLMVGVAAAATTPGQVLVAGLAGLVAGAMSMAAGEYVSVSSQADAEAADLGRERKELVEQPAEELEELTQIYVARGVEPELANAVAIQLMAKDALGAHAREELGIIEATAANPVQAAFASAASFAVGALVPVLLAMISPAELTAAIVSAGSLVLLAILGALGARAGGAGIVRPMVRVTFWGAVAMAVSAGVGSLVGLAL
jgi:VIT1/CCC1 family predicted Fe2+/Mn2+ transporter